MNFEEKQLIAKEIVSLIQQKCGHVIDRYDIAVITASILQQAIHDAANHTIKH